MKMPWSSLEGPAKVLAICGVVLLVSSGLCGLQSVIAFNGNGGSLDAIFIPLGIFELVAMAGSVLVGLLTLCAVLETKDGFSGMGRDTLETLFCFDLV